MTNKIKPLTNFRNLLDVDQLNKSDINYIFEYADKLQSIAKGSIRKIPALRGKTILNYFAEPSTRTRVSFENAGKILSADVINMSSSGSSDEKGESLFNSVQTLESIGANLLVMRHFDAGAPYFVARNIGIPVINAGDGSHAHPTQNLIDLYTVHKKVGNIEGLNLTVLGDNVHSRVARSTIIGFSIMGARITICAPTTMDAQYLSDNSSKKESVADLVSGMAGTNLTASNGGDNIVHVDTDGTVTTGVAYYSLGAASRGRGWLIWKIPHFGAHQGSSTGDYGYQCSQHNTMYGQIFISSIDVLVSHD